MPDGEVFSTNWFDPVNNYIGGSIVIDLSLGLYTTDGSTWNEVEEDHL